MLLPSEEAFAGQEKKKKGDNIYVDKVWLI